MMEDQPTMAVIDKPNLLVSSDDDYQLPSVIFRCRLAHIREC